MKAAFMRQLFLSPIVFLSPDCIPYLPGSNKYLIIIK